MSLILSLRPNKKGEDQQVIVLEVGTVKIYLTVHKDKGNFKVSIDAPKKLVNVYRSSINQIINSTKVTKSE